MTLLEILFLYLAFRAKQVLCDFFFQPSWIAIGKCKSFKEGGLKPLLIHVSIHAFSTLIIMMFFAPNFWWLAIVDFFAHFIIDKIKAVVTYKMDWTAKNNPYWWAFGIDQEAHNITHLVFIIVIVMYSAV